MRKYKSADGTRTIKIKDGFGYPRIEETNRSTGHQQEISIDPDKLKLFEIDLKGSGWKLQKTQPNQLLTSNASCCILYGILSKEICYETGYQL